MASSQDQEEKSNEQASVEATQGDVQIARTATKAFDSDIVSKLLKEDEDKQYVATGKADFELAERHQQARLIRDLDYFKGDEAGIERCVCCKLPVNAPTFDLWTDTYLLKQLGPGFPLYYRFIVFLWAVLLFVFVIAGAACWGYNLNNDKADDWDAEHDSFTIKSSLGNNGDPDERDNVFPVWQFALHLIAMVAVLIGYHIFWTRKQTSLQDDIDKDMSTPSDYTVYVSNLGKDFTEDEVKDFFCVNGSADGQPADVVKVTITYDISEFVELSRELQELKNSIKYIENYKQDHGGIEPPPAKICCFKKQSKSLEELRKRTEEVYLKLKRIEDELKPGVGRDLLNGQAFVTFKTQQQARLVRYKWDGEWQNRFWNLFFGCCNRKKLPLFKGKKIRVKRAPEPNDIFWENLSFSLKKRLSKIAVTVIFTLLCLGASFGLIYGTSYYQDKVYNSYESDDDPSNSDIVTIRALSIISSVGIVFINMVLGQLIRKTSAYEKHHTLTTYHSSVAIKLTIAQCLNTALIALIVNFDPHDSWFVPGGLATDMTYILLSNAIVQPISYLLSPMYLVRLCKRRAARKNPYCSQAEANMVFEGPPVDMAQRYASVMKTFIVTLAFAALIPLGILFSLFGLVFSYWVDKILLLRRHARPNRLSGNLSEVMSQFVPWAVLIYAVMTYVWMDALNPDQSQASFVWMLMVLGYIFLPIETFRKCRKADLGSYGKEADYEEAALSFVDDYDRENPVTSEKGWNWYFDLLHKKKLIKEEDLNRVKNELLSKMGDVKSFVNAYAVGNAGLQNFQSNAPFVQNVAATTQQKIKSAILINSGQNYFNSYQSQFRPYNAVYNSAFVHYGMHPIGTVQNVVTDLPVYQAPQAKIRPKEFLKSESNEFGGKVEVSQEIKAKPAEQYQTTSNAPYSVAPQYPPEYTPQHPSQYPGFNPPQYLHPQQHLSQYPQQPPQQHPQSYQYPQPSFQQPYQPQPGYTGYPN